MTSSISSLNIPNQAMKCPVGIISDLRPNKKPLTPEELGLTSFEESGFGEYRYVEYLEDLLSKGQELLYGKKTQEFIDEAKESIRLMQADIRDNNAKYYFLKDGDGLNASSSPYVAKLKSSGQFVWGSITSHASFQTHELALKLADKGQTVYINTATHGDKCGNMATEIVGAGDRDHLVYYSYKINEKYRGRIVYGAVQHKYNKPLEPEEANHVINDECNSIRNRFTSTHNLNVSTDLSGNFFPPELRCTRKLNLIKVPYFFDACHRNSLDGRVHFYGIEGIAEWIYQVLNISRPLHKPEKLQKMTPQEIVDDCIAQFSNRKQFLGKLKSVQCCVPECNAHFDITSAKFSEPLAKAIEAFNRHKQEIEAEKTARQAEIQGLKAVNTQQTEEITELKEDVAQKDSTITTLNEEKEELKGINTLQGRQITDLTSEKGSLEREKNTFKEERDTVKDKLEVVEQERDEAQVQLQEKSQKVDLLEDELILASIPLPEMRIGSGDPSKEMILACPVLENYPNQTWWVPRMRMEKSCVGNFLKGFFHGWIIQRANSFVSKDVHEFESDHFRVVNHIWRHNKQKILAMLSQKWVSFKRYEEQEWSSFVIPFIEELMTRGIFLERFNDIAKDHGVSIQYKGPENWAEKEANRWQPQTYQESINNLLCEVSRYVVASCIIDVVKDLPNTERQRRAEKEIMRKLYDRSQNSGPSYTSHPLDGAGLSGCR